MNWSSPKVTVSRVRMDRLIDKVVTSLRAGERPKDEPRAEVEVNPMPTGAVVNALRVAIDAHEPVHLTYAESTGETIVVHLEPMRLGGGSVTGFDFSLQQVRTQLGEMEFWMPAAHLQAGALDALCRHALLDGHPRPALPPRELHGMLMGFADLVFEHEGRYWVLDYKSNRLGEDGAAYDRTALEAAMAQHRYDVQAALYLLALHRLLRARLGEAYDPARQLGGALYFFLRGLDGPVGGEYAIATTPEVLALLDTLDPLLTDEALLA